MEEINANYDYEEIINHLKDNYNIKPIYINLENYYTDNYMVYRYGMITYELNEERKLLYLDKYKSTEDIINKIDNILGGNSNDKKGLI